MCLLTMKTLCCPFLGDSTSCVFLVSSYWTKFKLCMVDTYMGKFNGKLIFVTLAHIKGK